MSTEHCGPSQIAWATAAAQKIDTISRLNKRNNLLTSVTYDELYQKILHAQQKYSSKRSTRWLTKLQPIMDHLRTFSAAIAVLTQANPAIACLVWGSIQLVVDATSTFSHTLGIVQGMLQDITDAMPRFDEYMQLYAQRARLQQALLSIYCGYLDFCITAVEFFRCSVVVHLLRSFVFSGSLAATFEGIIKQIKRAAKEFMAEAKLAQAVSTKAIEQALPLVDILPKSTKLVLSVPWAQNSRFFGRKQELKEIYKHLLPDKSKQQSCVLHGMAGVGKTQVALEFCYQNRRTFPYIFWIPSEDEAQLTQAYSRIPHLVEASSSRISTDLVSDIEEASQWLCQNENWLLIFDNADAAELLSRYWPACGHGSVLVTTQDRKLVHRVRSELHLKAFTEYEGSRLLLHLLTPKRIANEKSSAELGECISREVNGLPLLLVGLAGYMVDSETPLSETLEDLKSWNQNDHVFGALALGSATFSYGRPVHMAFDISLNRIPPVALSVLRIMSMLSADAISEELIWHDLEDESLKFLGHQDKSRYVLEVRTPLVTRHLIEFHYSERKENSHSYSLHRQLQWKILNDMIADPYTLQRTFDQAVALVRRAFPPFSKFMVPMHKEWPIYKKSIAHVMRLDEVFKICNKSSPILTDNVVFAELLSSAGYYLFEQRLVEPCLAILSTAEQICNLVVSRKETKFSTVINPEACGSNSVTSTEQLRATCWQISHAIVLETQGLAGRRRSEEYITRVLQLREDYAKIEHNSEERFWSQVLLANAHNDMACQLIDMGRYSEAETHLKASFDMKVRLALERPIHPFKIAASTKNLVVVRLGQGKADEALSLSRQALDLVNDDKDSSVYARFRFIYGVCLMNVGRVAEALKVFQEVNSLGIAIFGKASMQTRNSSYSVALAQYRLGNFQEARATISHCTKPQDECQWSAVCAIRANYLHSLILKAVGDMAQATDMRATALTKLESLLSTHSPELIEGRYIGSMGEWEHMKLLDYAVPFEAGRFHWW
ncbi:hypothetical protein F5884DRAFT_857274 [Xylogone sp. PMI_703]|nr:hypothetical protein F5884DRAFT_857274 [Xylogone sp. PMI_703]